MIKAFLFLVNTLCAAEQLTLEKANGIDPSKSQTLHAEFFNAYELANGIAQEKSQPLHSELKEEKICYLIPLLKLPKFEDTKFLEMPWVESFEWSE